MSGRGERTFKKRKTLASQAGIMFSVARVRNQLRRGNYAKHIQTGASIYLATVLEYLVSEILEISGLAAQDNKKKRIIPRHIQLAIRNDNELNELLSNVTISQGGVLPFIHGVLLPKRTTHRTPNAE